MASATSSGSGSAERWGPLWGSRPRDWAQNEEQQVPTFEAAVSAVGLEAGQRVLDIGCGTGVFLRLAADRGAEPYGLDASGALLAIAAERVPGADLRQGDMQFLPYEDGFFDLVTGFNSFFFAADLTAALREAGRVARPGAPVVIQVWGRPEHCDLEAMKAVARPFMPSPPPGSPPAPELWRPGVLEAISAEAGLEPETAFDTRYAFEYPDEGALGRMLVAPAGIAELAGPDRVDDLRGAIVEALAPHRTPGGGYSLENEWHYLVTRAPA